MPILTFEQYNNAPDPEQLKGIYDSGFQGVVRDPGAYASLRSLAPRFYAAFPEARGAGKGRVSLPFRAALALDPEFGRYEAQTTGDCVSHSDRNAGMIDYCVDAMFGETSFEGRFATENIYGWRGHGGQGADCARLAGYASPEGPGGFLVRKKYTDGANTVDLSVYNSSIGHNWGSRGTPDWLNKIAAKNKSLLVLACKSVEEARDAIAFGFGISVCSGYGFADTRNEDGLCEQSGSWSHAMAWIGYDDSDWAHQKYGGGIPLDQNSWGLWNRGPKRYEQPDGSFWMRPQVAASMIRGGGAWIIGSVAGYNRQLIYDRLGFVYSLAG